MQLKGTRMMAEEENKKVSREERKDKEDKKAKKKTEVPSHVKGYFKETSVHGFKYVVEGSTFHERAVWIAAILVAFAYSAYLVQASIDEAKQNPISTSVDVVPISDVPFPAVSVASSVEGDKFGHDNSVYNFVVDVLNSLEFDCFQQDDACMDRTADLRRDFRPLLANVVRVFYDKMKDAVSDDSDVRVTYRARELSRLKTNRMDQTVARGFCSIDSNLTDDDEDRFVAMLMDTFRAPRSAFINASLEFAEGFTLYNSSVDCPASDGDLSLRARAMISSVVFLNQNYSRVELRLGDLVALSYYGVPGYYFKTKIRPDHPNHGSVSDLLDDIAGGLDDEDDAVTANDVLSHALWEAVASAGNLTGSILRRSKVCDQDFFYKYRMYPGFCNAKILDTPCCVELQKGIDVALAKVLKVLKHASPPVAWGMASAASARDVDAVSAKLNYSRKSCFGETTSCFHSDPRIVGCRFGSRDSFTHDCDLFLRTFSSEGVAYTFNAVDFWDMYRATPESTLFHREMRNGIFGSNDTDRRLPLSSPTNGFSFGLEFLLRPEHIHFYKGASPRFKVAVHDPAALPENFVELSPGMKHTILVTPSLITSDPAVLMMDESAKQCRGPEGDDVAGENGGDDIFARYSRSNCLFNCRLRRAHTAVGCVPWDFPRFPSSSVCSASEARKFSRLMEDVVVGESARECDCPNDCSSVTYSYSVLSEPAAWGDGCDRDVSDLPDDVPSFHEVVYFLKGTLPASSPGGRARFLNLRQCEEETRRLARVRVHMVPMSVPNVRRLRRTSFTDQVASLGGVIGLFTGMSFLSLMEIFFWASRAMLCCIRKKKDGKGGRECIHGCGGAEVDVQQEEDEEEGNAKVRPVEGDAEARPVEGSEHAIKTGGGKP